MKVVKMNLGYADHYGMKMWCQFWIINTFKPAPSTIEIFIPLRDIRKLILN